MAYLATAHGVNAYTASSQAQIASNSLAVEQGNFVSLASGFMALSGAGDTIEGVSITDKTFTSDNQTVAQDVVIFTPARPEDLYEVEISGGTITQADVGKFYDLVSDTDQRADGTSESASTGQLRLEEIISSTLGIFSVRNA